MAPFPGVVEALTAIRERGCAIVICTESPCVYAESRVHKLGIAHLVDAIYARDTAPLFEQLEHVDRRQLRRRGSSPLRCLGLPWNLAKPDPMLLKRILRDFNCEPANAVYVGDSLFKDIQMARATGVTAVHAAYGTTGQHAASLELLQEVSHWSQDAIQTEARLRRDSCRGCEPDLVLPSTLVQLLGFVRFSSHAKLVLAAAS